MTQLSSSFLTAWQRRYLPGLVSLILLGVLIAILVPPMPPARIVVPALVVLALVALAYFSAYRALFHRVADRVVLDGDLLRVTRAGKEAAIPVASITAIHSATAFSPETITLDLAAESGNGSQVMFIPPARFPSRHEHPILAPLRAAIHSTSSAARTNP